MEPIRYITSLLTFYLKGEIYIDQHFITFKEPNTILGFIPLGAKKQSIAIDQIASTQTNMRLKLGKLIAGIIITIIGYSAFSDSLLASLLFFIIGANCIIDAFEVNLRIALTSGQVKLIDFLIFEKSKSTQAEMQINAMISNRLYDTNNRQQTDRIVAAMYRK